MVKPCSMFTPRGKPPIVIPLTTMSKAFERFSEPVSGKDIGTNCPKNLALPFVFRLFDKCRQCHVKLQARGQQTGKLPCCEGEIGLAQAIT